MIDEPVDRLRVLLRAGPAQVWGEAQDPAFLTPGEAGAAGPQSTRGVRSQADGVQTVLNPFLSFHIASLFLAYITAVT